MEKQIVVIHGGDTFETHEDFLSFLKDFVIDDLRYFKGKRWKDNLQDDLGEEFEVIVPQMPNKSNAHYAEWEIWFNKIAPLLNEQVVLVGHSLGGIFLAKYLSENQFPKKIAATFLVAACFDADDSEYSLGDFILPSDLTKFAHQGGMIYLYHSKDDEVVPYADVEKYKSKLPQAQVVSFSDRGHFSQEHLPELVQTIKGITFE
jgi:uncharacterized protein